MGLPMFTMVAVLQGITGDASSSGVHTLQMLRSKCCTFISPCSRYRDPIVWFGFVNWRHQVFFHLLCCFYLNTLHQHLPPQESDLRLEEFIISSPSSILWSITFLPALPELSITCLQLKHPFHAEFADIKSWWPFALMAGVCAQRWCHFFCFGFVRFLLCSHKSVL